MRFLVQLAFWKVPAVSFPLIWSILAAKACLFDEKSLNLTPNKSRYRLSVTCSAKENQFFLNELLQTPIF